MIATTFARHTLLVIALARVAQAALYSLSDNYVGPSFLTGFEHQKIRDPTNGRGLYVDQETALAANLTYVSPDTLILRADSHTVLQPTDEGRKTVRIRSLKTYREHVVIFDVRHMPQGCGTWPAAWETDEGAWPTNGEIDILEGANDRGPNAATLHTGPGCSMPDSRPMFGASKQKECDVAVNSNTGCGVKLSVNDNGRFHSGDNSYGPSFNAGGGGYYVMERTPSKILVWFWPRSGGAPTSVLQPDSQLETATFGMPSAAFPNTQCDFDKHFGAHNIIINLALCGDWAGSTYNQDGCPGSCIENVNSNPAGFSEAFWDIAAVRVYEPVGAMRMMKHRRTGH